MRCGPIRRKRPVTTEERRRAYSVKAWPRTEIEAVGEPAGSIMRALAGNPRERSSERFGRADRGWRRREGIDGLPELMQRTAPSSERNSAECVGLDYFVSGIGTS
jgi:hypothetical protein